MAEPKKPPQGVAMARQDQEQGQAPTTARAARAAVEGLGADELERDTGDAGAEEEDNGSDPADDSIYGDQDDAQSFIQPAISPVATRLSSQRTPAAEKAMAMEGRAGYFGSVVAAHSANANITRNAGPLRSSTASVGSSGQPGTPLRTSTVRSSVFASSGFSGSRHLRSLSVGSDAFRRLSKALPSISLPNASTFLPSLSSSSFFSSLASPSQQHQQQQQQRKITERPALQRPATAAVSSSSPSAEETSPVRHTIRAAATAPLQKQPSLAAPRRPNLLRRSTSDDSLLYQTLSRVSSVGDDGRFDNVRDQVNSRVKAIIDSFSDRPAFKLPQLNFFPDGKATSTAREPASPLDAALAELTGDVVVLGGYRGSILRSAEPPHRQLWVPVKVGLNIRKVNLEIGLDHADELNAKERIFPSGMLQHIGPVDISRRLFRKLRESENARKGLLRVHDYGYDWRLSPRLLSEQLVAFLASLPSNQDGEGEGGGGGGARRGAIVIAHSLGGLITRHAVNLRPDLFSGVIYAGAPQRCVNILGPLRNGDAVLLNEKVLTAQVNFSLRTTFVFLPEDGFCFVNSKNIAEEYRVNFYDIDDWIRYRWSPCVGPPVLPPYHSSGGGDGAAGDISVKRSSTIGTLLEDLSGGLPSLPLRSRNNHNNNNNNNNNNAGSASGVPGAPEVGATAAGIAAGVVPQMDGRPAAGGAATPLASSTREATSPAAADTSGAAPSSSPDGVDPLQARNREYLVRTLAEIRQFRAELAHRPELAAANAYPPLAVIYGKGIPTLYAARVASRDAIACSDAYDDLVFRSGDGVVLAREAMVPPGYHLVRGGYVSSEKGHISLLGDLTAVGTALQAILRGRRKGIGLGREVTGRPETAGLGLQTVMSAEPGPASAAAAHRPSSLRNSETLASVANSSPLAAAGSS